MLELNVPLAMVATSTLVAVQLFHPRAPRLLRFALAALTILFSLSYFFWKIRVAARPEFQIAIIAAVAILIAVNIAFLVILFRRRAAPRR